MSVRRKRLLRRSIALGVLALCVAVGALRTRAAWETACTLARRQLPALLGLEVGINACEVDPLGQRVILSGVSAFEPGAEQPLFVADSLEVAVRGIGLTSLDLQEVVLVRPRMRLVSSASGGAEASDGCALDLLRRVRIDRVSVKDGSVEVKLPRSQQLSLSGIDLGWRTRRGVQEFQLEARQGAIALGEGRDLTVSRLSVEGGLDADEELLELTRGELAVDDVTLTLGGKVESLCEPVLGLEGQLFVPMRFAARMAGSRDEVDGSVWARVSVSGSPRAPIARLELVGSGLRWDPFAPGDFTARLALGGDELEIEELVVPAGAGVVRASGSVRLERNLPLKLKVESDRAQFAHILHKAGLPGAWVDFPASMRGSFAGTLRPLDLFGEADVRSGRFVLATRAFDAPESEGKTLLTFPQGHAQVRVAVHPDRVELVAGRVELPPARPGGIETRVEADVTLHFDPSRGLSIHGASPAVDLSTFGELAGLHLGGKGAARFSIVGPYTDVRIDSQVSLRELELWDLSLGVVQGKITYRDRLLRFPSFAGQKGKTPYFGNAELEFLEEDVHLRLEADVPKGSTADLVNAIVRLHPSLEMFQGELEGEASGRVHFDSPFELLEGEIVLDVRDTRYYGRRIGDGKATLRFVGGEKMVLEPMVLSGPLGLASVDGSFTFHGPLDYRFRVERLSLAELLDPERARRLGAAGDLTLVGRVHGDSEVPRVTAQLTSPRIIFAGRSLGAARIEGRIQGREAQITGQPFEDARGELALRLQEPFPFEGKVALTLPEIRPLLPDGAVSQGLSGSVSAELQAKGQVRELRAVKASARIERLRLQRGDFTGQNAGPVVLAYSGGRLELEPLTFVGPNTELHAAGWCGPEQLDLRVRGGLDLRLLESFVPQLERSAGRVELSATASGSVRQPSLAGSAEVFDARLTLRDRPISIRSLSGRLDFSEARVLVQDVFGILNDGRLAMQGDIRLSDFKPRHLELNLGLEEVSFRPLEDLPLTTSGELLLAGKPDALQLSGGLDIVKLRYEKDLELESLLRDVRRVRVGGGGGEKPSEWLRFDVDIAASGDVRIDNNLAKAKLGGKLKLIGTNVRPGLIGTIEAAEGSQAFFRGNQLAISKGELQFRDKDAIDPFVDLYAQTQVREYLVTLKAFGRLSELADPNSQKLILSADPSLTRADVVSLLTLGVTSRDRDVASGAGAALAAEALFTASGLDKQVQRFLPKNALLRDLQFHLSTSYNEASGQVEPTAQLESKFLTDQLTLGVTQPVVSGRGTKAQAEYRFNRRFSARAQWDNESQDSSFGNPGLDLRWRFEAE